jgi:hypothetical protein
MQGYDGDHLWVSLTKDEAKSKFEGEKDPPASIFKTPEYLERRTTITKQYPDFQTNIPAYAGRSVAMSWDKIIDRKVKSSDNEDIGKVESIAPDYVEVKEGAVHKKHYFIPKYYVQGFDGENMRMSLTKDGIKDRFERDNPPTESEFQTEEYMEHRTKVDSTYPQFIHGIPWMAKEQGVKLQTEQSDETLTIPWEEVIHKRVKTTDNVDVGDIELVGNEFIVVREGEVNIRHYYIPKSYINNYDGSAVYVAALSGLLSAKFEREIEPTPEEIKKSSEESPRPRPQQTQAKGIP